MKSNGLPSIVKATRLDKVEWSVLDFVRSELTGNLTVDEMARYPSIYERDILLISALLAFAQEGNTSNVNSFKKYAEFALTLPKRPAVDNRPAAAFNAYKDTAKDNKNDNAGNSEQSAKAPATEKSTIDDLIARMAR